MSAALLGGCKGLIGDPPPPPPPAADYFVSEGGSDLNPGTQSEPFRHIGHALAMAGPGQKIQVLPGLYDQGETFPLRIPAGVELIGDVEGKGVTTRIQGNGQKLDPTSDVTAVVVLGNGSRLAGFEVTSDTQNAMVDYDAAVAMMASASILERCRLVHSEHGLYVGGGLSQVIRENFIADNLSNGILFHKAGDHALVEKNTVRDNLFKGINIRDAHPDLGGGLAGSTGGNYLGHNAQHDVYFNHVEARTLKAERNYWTDVNKDPVANGQAGTFNQGSIDAQPAYWWIVIVPVI